VVIDTRDVIRSSPPHSTDLDVRFEKALIVFRG
jgi:hypothetical protein